MRTQLSLPSWREVLWLTVPQMGLMCCHLCISLTDVWVAGRLEPAVLAALGIVTQVFYVLMLLTSVAGSGCMALVSQALGGGKSIRAGRYARLVLLLACLMGVLVGAVAVISLPYGLRMLQNPALREPVRIFVVAYSCHLPLLYLTIIINTLFRAHKLVWLPLLPLSLSAAVNYAGSMGFGLGLWGLPQLGYVGVAWSTVASGAVGLLCTLPLLLRNNILGPYTLPPLRWVRVALPRLWRIGIPAILGQLAGQGGSLMLLACLAAVPGAVDAVAGMTLGSRIMGGVQFPLAALGMTLTICCGHLLGARQAEACYRLGWRTALFAGAGMVVCAWAVYAAGGRVTLFFATEPGAVAEANRFLGYACLALPLQTVTMLLHSVFSGAGATRLSSTLSVTGMWVVTVPLAQVLSHSAAWGATGVYAGMAAGAALVCLATVWAYYRRKWLVCFLPP